MLKRFSFLSALSAVLMSVSQAAASPCTITIADIGCDVVEVSTVVDRSLTRLTQPADGGPKLDIGATIPRGEYSILLNAEYYGLPAVTNGWVYMNVERQVYRVDFFTHEVLENVTHLTAANW